ETVRVLDDLSTGRREQLPAWVELIVGDVGDAAVARAAVDGAAGCFHLAAVASVARCHEDWAAASRGNVGGTVNLRDAACGPTGGGTGIPVVYASSAAVYGDNAELPLAETSATRPLSPYGVDKLASELHARAGAAVRGAASIGLRFFNVYGP